MSGVTRWVLGRGRDGPWSGVRLLQSERVASSPGAAATSYTNWGFTVVEVFSFMVLEAGQQGLAPSEPPGKNLPVSSGLAGGGRPWHWVPASPRDGPLCGPGPDSFSGGRQPCWTWDPPCSRLGLRLHWITSAKTPLPNKVTVTVLRGHHPAQSTSHGPWLGGLLSKCGW